VTVLISHWHARDRARVLSRVFLGVNAGQLTLVPLGGLLIEHAGYRAAYLVLGLLVLVVVAPAIAVRTVSRPAASQPVREHGTRLGDALRSRWFWLATLAFGINGWTLYFTLLHVPRYARDLGGSLAAGGVLLAVAAAASGLGMLASGRLAARWGRRRVVIALFWWRAAVLGVAALATTSGQLVVVAAAFGLASFPVIPLVMSLISDRYGTQVLGAVLGVVFASHQVFAGLGVYVGGLLRASTGSYDAALLIAAALLVLGSGLLLALDDAHAPSSPLLASAPLREPTTEGRITS
jgi:predicted MFS family arabinose efflux permease